MSVQPPISETSVTDTQGLSGRRGVQAGPGLTCTCTCTCTCTWTQDISPGERVRAGCNHLRLSWRMGLLPQANSPR